MKTKTLLIAFLISIIGLAFGQNEKNNWYFGNGAGITFNTSPPSAIPSYMYQKEGVSSISDAAGNTLLYSDGNNLYNNNLFSVGIGLSGSAMSAQSCLIAPSPASGSQYYVFAMNDWITHINGLTYQIVDISNNNIMTQPAVSVNTGVREQLAAVYHANCKDIWIICHEGGINVAANNNYLAYLLTDQGLQTTPVVSSVGMTYSGSNRYGSIKFNKSGDKLCSTLGKNGTFNGTTIELLDFDNATGIVSNPVVIADNAQAQMAYSSEFSPDGTKLYVTSYSSADGYIYQYDISSGASSTIMASKNTIVASDKCNVLQIGPDDKIYVSRYHSDSLGVINDPNNAGTNCNYSSNGIILSSNTYCSMGLPNFVQGCGGYNTNPVSCQASFNQTVSCDSVSFYDYSSSNTNASIVSWHWDFGDGATSSLQNPTHAYTSPGYYNVVLTITTSDSCTSTSFNTVIISDAFFGYYQSTNCDIIFTDSSLVNFNTPIIYRQWDLGDGTVLNGNSLQYGYFTHTYAASGTYWVCLEVMTPDSCIKTYCDSIVVNCTPPPPSSCQASFYSYPDTVVNCYTQYFNNTSTATNSIVSWSWSFGDGSTSNISSPSHTYAANGSYNVCLTIMTSDSCVSTFCDTVNIYCNPLPSSCQASYFFTPDNANCYGINFTNTSTASTYIASMSWDFGDGNTSNSSNPSHSYAANGTYNVCLTIITMDSCVSTYCNTLTIYCNPVPSSCQAGFYAQVDTFDCYKAYFANYSTASTNIISWNWDLGDGTTSNQQNVYSHTYTANGTYNVCLTIMTSDSCVSTYCDTVVINCNPVTPSCQADFTAILDTTVANSTTFNFVDQSTSSSPIVQLLWDYGDGNLSTLSNPTHTYASSGAYWVCLTIVTSDSCVSNYCDSIYTDPAASIAELMSFGELNIFPNPAQASAIVSFDASMGQEYALELYDLTGSIVRKLEGVYDGNVRLNKNELPSGLYFLELRSASKSYRGKLIFK